MPDIEALALDGIAAGSLTLAEAFLLDRLYFMIEVAGDVRDGLRSLRTGRRPKRDVTIPGHQDYLAVVLNATRVLVSIGLIASLSVWSGLPDTSLAILYTAVFVSLGSLQPDPSVLGKAALLGLPLVALTGAVYVFFIFPNIESYPLFIVSLAPLVLAMCWLIKIGQPGMAVVFGVQSLVLISPANVQTLDPQNFVSTATMLTASGAAIFLSFLLIIPVSPAQRRLRLALAVGDSLRKALADEKRLKQPRASLQYDRLSQLATWQRGAAPTLVRRKTMKRLFDIGALAYVVRRSWRALDRSRLDVNADIDARARRVLPSLSPDETLDLARTYLAAARGKEREPALSLVHAAAALYGVAILTTEEKRFLKYVELLRRPI